MGLTKPRAAQIYDIDYKQATRVVAVTNITLAGGAPATVDGVSLSVNDRVLVTAQSTGSQNGIYLVSTVGSGSNGTWVRTSDADATGEIEAGMIVMVTEGSVYADTQWKLITDDPINIGSTALTFTQNYSANSISGGTSNVTVYSNANVTISSAGTANVLTVSSTGIVVAGTASATGNITGSYFIGNGSQLTGIAAGSTYSNSNVTSLLASFGSNTISTTGSINSGNITGGNILTSGLVSASGTITGTSHLGAVVSVTGAVTSASVVGGVITGTSTSVSGSQTAASTVGGIITGSSLSVTGIVTGTSHVGSVVSVTGNVTAGNLIATTYVLAGNGLESSSTYPGPYTDGIVIDYLTGNGRISTGAADGLNIFNGGVANTLIASFNTTGALTLGTTGTANLTGGNVLAGGLVSASGTITGTSHVGAVVSVTGAITGGNIVTAGQLTVNSSANVTAIVNGATSGVGNIGSTTVPFNTVFAKATTAQYADLAEKYVADNLYGPGTIVEFGGNNEITSTTFTHSVQVAGIISTQPAYLMNSTQAGDYALEVALVGRVPCSVVGTIRKGDRLVSSDLPGVATALDIDQYQPGCIVAKALEDYNSAEPGVIEVAVGRT